MLGSEAINWSKKQALFSGTLQSRQRQAVPALTVRQCV